VFIVHNVTSGSELDDVNAAIEAFKTTHKMHSRVVVGLRDEYRDAAKSATGTVEFIASTKKITRSAGSYITDGFKVGDTITSPNAVSNPGPFTATVVTALEITVSEVLVNEGPTAGIKVLGVESHAAWTTAVSAITAGKDAPRTAVAAGRAMRRSPINGLRKRRNAAWPILNRFFKHDLQVSAGRKSDGALEEWTIFSDASKTKPQEHDERTDGGLLAARIMCLRTYLKNPGSTFAEKMVTLDAVEGKPLSRLPVGCVSDLVCDTIHGETEDLLGSNPQANDNGTLLEDVALQFDRRVMGRLRSILFGGDLREGPRASKVLSFSISRTAKVTVAGTEVPTDCVFVPLGTIEKMRNRVVVTTGTED
jgi:hypothetical protein